VTKSKPTNLPASVRQRLANLAREQNEDFQLVLTRYVLERLLYRLSRSHYCEQFVLKGAMLFPLWGGQPHRPTRDLDLLGRGENSIAAAERAFRDVCRGAVEADGLTFLADTVHGEVIKEAQEYEGLRLSLECRLENARISVQIDIGFGDAVVPGPVAATYPVMLDFPAPVLDVYSRESVVAEKLQAMVILGIANSRMKDFYDLWVLARQFEFQGPVLCRAIWATFQRRRTPLPAGTPLALTPEFFNERAKQAQWRAFLDKGRLGLAGISLGDVALVLRAFLTAPITALRADRDYPLSWPPGGPWSPSDVGSAT
jgi:predicted nucleotidyltransferase component of viral defense system